jgi:integrase
MASIDKRPDGGYRARWREYPGGPQRTKHFSRKGNAESFLDRIRGDLARGVYVDPAGGQTRFRDYAETWRAAQVHRKSTSDQAKSYLTLHAYPTFGDRAIGSIRPTEIQAWVKGRSQVLAPGSVQIVYRWVASIFKAAVRDRLIAVSPCTEVKLPKVPKAEVVPPTIDQIGALASAVPDRFRALIVFGAGTGLRQGECFGLTVDRVDFLRHVVHVDRQLISVRSGIPQFGPPKSEAGYRTVPVPEFITELLAKYLAEYGSGPDDLIFTNSAGRPLRRSTFGSMWRRATSETGQANTTFHDLRHFYASLRH